MSNLLVCTHTGAGWKASASIKPSIGQIIERLGFGIDSIILLDWEKDSEKQYFNGEYLHSTSGEILDGKPCLPKMGGIPESSAESYQKIANADAIIHVGGFYGGCHLTTFLHLAKIKSRNGRKLNAIFPADSIYGSYGEQLERERQLYKKEPLQIYAEQAEKMGFGTPQISIIDFTIKQARRLEGSENTPIQITLCDSLGSLTQEQLHSFIASPDGTYQALHSSWNL